MKNETKNTRKSNKINNWKIASIVLGALLIVSVLIGGFGNSSKNIDSTSEEIIDYINQKLLSGETTATLKSVEDTNGMYKMMIELEGQEMEVYTSYDGKLFFPQVIDLSQDINPDAQKTQNTNAPTQSIRKADKPIVELFVMSHCPYGTQMEKGMLPVAKELGDYIDFEIKFVNYAMHPTQGEVEEQLNQYCIQRDYKDKYLSYLSEFLKAGSGDDALSSIGLTEGDISQCVEETDKEFDVIKNLEDKSSWSSGRFPKFMIHNEENQKYGIKGSPTLVINGEQAQSGRDAQSILSAVCASFTNAPEECGLDMSSYGTPGPGFGFETQGGSATAAGCGA